MEKIKDLYLAGLSPQELSARFDLPLVCVILQLITLDLSGELVFINLYFE